jgi:hypothetical protein
MGIFERWHILEGLPKILHEIWQRCLNDLADKNEQRNMKRPWDQLKRL